MSEMGEMFNEHRKARQEKRASNRDQSAVILQRAGVIFEEKNLGSHLIVLGGAKTIDFWPGTGLWIVRGTMQKRRGVRKLIQFVEQQRSPSQSSGDSAAEQKEPGNGGLL